MPKNKTKESPEKQFKRFKKTVQDMVVTGELNPTEADERFERAMKQIALPQPPRI
jgi:polyhydroxyalkanoate synthesis regulator phasin